MKNPGFEKTELMRFSRNICIVFSIYGTVLLAWQSKNYIWFYLAAAAVVFCYFFIPTFLAAVYFLVKKIVYMIGWCAGKLVLLFLFYIIFSLMGLLFRIFQKDLLDRKIEKSKKSYWKEEEEKPLRRVSYERQY
jgi:uncharacterized protein YqhQ